MTNGEQTTHAPEHEVARRVLPVFESNFVAGKNGPAVLGAEITTDEQTDEEFLSLGIGVPASIPPTEHPRPYLAPVVQAYVVLVDEAGLDYPLEAPASVHPPSQPETRVACGCFRVAVLWAREHVHGNYTLEQLLNLVLRTYKRPTSVAEAATWVPEYPLEWRSEDPKPADEFEAQVGYEYWRGESVPYPPETGEGTEREDSES